MVNVSWINREQHIHSSEPRSLEWKCQVRGFKNLNAVVIDPVERHEQSGKHPENWPVPKEPAMRFLEEQVMDDEKANDSYGSSE